MVKSEVRVLPRRPFIIKSGKEHRKPTNKKREPIMKTTKQNYHSLEESETIGHMVKDNMLCPASRCDGATLERLKSGKTKCPKCLFVYDF